MDSVGRKITTALENKGITIKSLARSLSLSVLTIQNIIYGKSRKVMYLKEIESFLGITLLNIDPEFSVADSTSCTVDVDRLDHIFTIIRDVIRDMKTSMPKKQLDILSSLTYDLYVSNPLLNDRAISMFISGMLKLGFASKFFDLNLSKSVINCEDGNQKIDVDTLYLCLAETNSVLKEINASITKKNIDIVTGILYDLIKSKPTLSKKEIRMFLLGTLKLGEIIKLVN